LKKYTEIVRIDLNNDNAGATLRLVSTALQAVPLSEPMVVKDFDLETYSESKNCKLVDDERVEDEIRLSDCIYI
jgi:hypothetical protein